MASSFFSYKLSFYVLIALLLSRLIYPAAKEIWYDEMVSIKIANGFSYTDETTAATYNSLGDISTFREENNLINTVKATIDDNSNSITYNVALHLYNLIVDHTIKNYMFLSLFFSALTLIATYLFAKQLTENEYIISLSLVLLAFDLPFFGMGWEIRAYSLTILFCVTSALFLWLSFKKDRNYFIYLGLFSVFAVLSLLSHYLALYIIATLCLIYLIKNKGFFMPLKSLAAVMPALIILGVWFAISMSSGYAKMEKQNANIVKKKINTLSVSSFIHKSVKHTLASFRIPIAPNFAVSGNKLALVSFALVAALAFLLFYKRSVFFQEDMFYILMLGGSATVFLSCLAIVYKNEMPFYFRYFSFAAPFANLFIASAYINFIQAYRNKVLAGGLICILAITLFIGIKSFLMPEPYQVKYSHSHIADNINELEEQNVVIKSQSLEDLQLISIFLNDDDPFKLERTNNCPKDTVEVIAPNKPNFFFKVIKIDS